MNFKDMLDYEQIDQILRDEKIYYSSSCGIDRISSKRFYENRKEEIEFIIKKLKAKSYKFSPYKINLINKGPNKDPRITCIATIRDRAVLSIIKKYLYGLYDGDTINIPANKIVSNIDSEKKLKQYDFFIKLDIESFFNNIDHEILIDKLSEKIEDEYVLTLIKKILENPQKYQKWDNKVQNLIGVPQGLSISTILANLYLQNFDEKMKKYDIKYFRYVDDIFILCRKNEKNEIIRKTKIELKNKYGLNLNKDKILVGNLKDHFEFLGYSFDNLTISVKKTSKIKFEEKLELVFKNFVRQKNFDERNIKKFIWILNSKITGIRVDNKNFGWLYYYSKINDKSLLIHLDKLIVKFFEKYNLKDKADISMVKSFLETYKYIRYKKIGQERYLLNLNQITLQEKIDFLETICGIEVEKNGINGEELDRKFRFNFYRTLKSLERDIDSISN